MSSATLILIIAAFWWLFWLMRLKHFMGTILKVRLFWYPMICTYGLGMNYTLFHPDIDLQLQTMFQFTHLPIVLIFKFIMFFFVTMYYYFIPITRYTIFHIPDGFIRSLLASAILFPIITIFFYNHIAYARLQLIYYTFVPLAGLYSAVLLLPIVRYIHENELDEVKRMHHACSSLALGFLSLAMVMVFVNSCYLIASYQPMLSTSLFDVSMIVYSVGIIGLALLLAPDPYIRWILIPSNLLLYKRLKQLHQRIYGQKPLRMTYYLPPKYLPLWDLDFHIYKIFIAIIDGVQLLEKNSKLRRQIRRIENQQADYYATVMQLSKLLLKEV
jgi:hypothetical protein